MISKTGIHVDTASNFTNPLVYEENGQVNHVVADNLTPSTRYYTRGYVISDGTTVYSGNVKSFVTESIDYLTFSNPNNTSINLTLTKNGSPTAISGETSIDGGQTWTAFGFSGVTSQTWSIPAGEKIKFRGTNSTISSSYNDYYQFSSASDIEVSGNVMTLLDPTGMSTTISTRCCFYKLFKDMSNLENAGIKLPATTLTNYCYSYMFYGTAITMLPELPATTLAANCYSSIFYGCTELVDIPADLLPATTLVEGCYNSMFYGCTSITDIPSGLLPAMTLARYAYGFMFSHCSSLTYIPADLLPATSLPDGLTTNYNTGVYANMFAYCTALTTIPSGLLPATSLGIACYDYMFGFCTSLVNIPTDLLSATTMKEACYNSMFSGCSTLDNPPKLPATTLAKKCYVGMFRNCVSLQTAPPLPATTLASESYCDLFRGCSALSSIEVGATSWNTANSDNWVQGVAANGDFYLPSGLTVPTGTSGIPSGWATHTI